MCVYQHIRVVIRGAKMLSRDAKEKELIELLGSQTEEDSLTHSLTHSLQSKEGLLLFLEPGCFLVLLSVLWWVLLQWKLPEEKDSLRVELRRETLCCLHGNVNDREWMEKEAARFKLQAPLFVLCSGLRLTRPLLCSVRWLIGPVFSGHTSQI